MLVKLLAESVPLQLGTNIVLRACNKMKATAPSDIRPPPLSTIAQESSMERSYVSGSWAYSRRGRPYLAPRATPPFCYAL
jgi:hypothetical protein